MMPRLSRLLEVRPDERRPVGLMFAFRFAAGFTFVVSDNMAITLFLSRFKGSIFGFEGVAALPVVYIVGAMATVLTGFAMLYLQRHFSMGKVIVGNLFAIILLIAFFYAAISADVSPYIYPAFFIVTELVWMLIALNAEVTMNSLFNVRQAKRVLGVINAGEPLGFIVGGFAAAGAVKTMGVENTLLMAIVAGVIALAIYVAILRLGRGGLAVVAPRERARRGGYGVFRSRFALLMIAFVLALQISLYITFFQSRAAVNLIYEEAEIAICLGILEGSLGAGRALFSFILANRVIAKIGLFAVAAILPVGLVVAGLMVLASPLPMVFAFIVAIYVVDRLLRYSLGSATLPLMYHCLPENQRIRLQSFVSGVIAPVGAALAGGILLIFGGALSSGFPGLVSITYGIIGIGLITLPIIWLLRSEYLSRLLKMAQSSQSDDGTEIVDSTAAEALRERLASEDPIDAVFAMGAMQTVDPAHLVEAMPGLIRHPRQAVRVRALRVLVELSRDRDLTELADLLGYDDTADEETRIASIQALAAILRENAYERLRPATEELSPRVRAAALAALAQWGGAAGFRFVEPVVATLAASGAKESRLQALEIVRGAGIDSLWPAVEVLLSDTEPEVRAGALEAVGALRLKSYYPDLATGLADRDIAATVRRVLIRLGFDALPTLLGVVSSEGNRVPRAQALQLIGRLEHPDAQAALSTAMDSDDVRLRHIALEQMFHAKTLGRQPGAEALSDLFESESRHFLELAQLALTVGRVVETDPSDGAGLLRDALQAALDDSLLRLLYQLRLTYPADIMRSVHTTWERSGSRHVALEILDNILRGPLKDRILVLFDQISLIEKVGKLSRRGSGDSLIPAANLGEVVGSLLHEDGRRFGEWCAICALYAMDGLDTQTRISLANPYKDAENPILREVASRALGQGGPARGENEAPAMLSTIEKLLYLKRASIFAQVRDEYLATLARNVEEVSFDKGEVIMKEGDVGDSMYIIVSGSVDIITKSRGHLATMGGGEVVGEMAVLDAEPRSASVVAAADSVLLMIEGRELFDIMAREIEIARGLFKVLSGRLREARG
jgi:HEAT repeat protein